MTPWLTRLLLGGTTFLLSSSALSPSPPPLATVLPQHTLSFPLLEEPTPAAVRRLSNAFTAMVQKDAFFEPSVDQPSTVAAVPLFGNDAAVQFQLLLDDDDGSGGGGDDDKESAGTYFRLSASGCTAEEFGWICVRFHEEKGAFAGLDHSRLRRAVARHFNSLGPHPGYDAHASHWCAADADADPTATAEEAAAARAASAALVRSLLPAARLAELRENGFVVVDGAFFATETTRPPAAAAKDKEEQHEQLAKHLARAAARTGQAAQGVRTDRVAFLSRAEARGCGLQGEYDLLLAVAAHLNDHAPDVVEPSPFEPVPPGTAARPLTNPRHVQAAEYGPGDFYATHSDNGLSPRPSGSSSSSSSSSSSEEGAFVRRNFRCFTCIYYLNEGWREEDGGALRIRRGSGALRTMAECEAACAYEDVLPLNGRLLVFDSRLAHEVRPNTHREGRARRALTVWITRPETSGARGEVWDEGEEEAAGGGAAAA